MKEAGKATIEGTAQRSFLRAPGTGSQSQFTVTLLKLNLYWISLLNMAVNMSKLIDEVTKDLHDDEEEGLE